MILLIKRTNSELKFEIFVCKKHVLSFLLMYNVYISIKWYFYFYRQKIVKVILIDKGINLHRSTFTFSRYTASFLRERIRHNRRVLCNLQVHSANSIVFITENMFRMIRIYRFQIYNLKFWYLFIQQSDSWYGIEKIMDCTMIYNIFQMRYHFIFKI